MYMKGRGMMMAALAFAALSEGINKTNRPMFNPDTETDKANIQEATKQNLLKRGCKEFTIDGYTVIARDYKNALRKVNNLKSTEMKIHYTSGHFYIEQDGKKIKIANPELLTQFYGYFRLLTSTLIVSK